MTSDAKSMLDLWPGELNKIELTEKSCLCSRWLKCEKVKNDGRQIQSDTKNTLDLWSG